MGKETMYSGVLGLLVRLTAALGGNASDLAHRAESRLDPLVEGQRLASGMTVFPQVSYGIRSGKLTELGRQSFRGRRLRAPKTPEPPTAPKPVPPAVHSLADASTQQ